MKRKSKGYSLIELVAAMALLSTVFLIVGQFFTSTTKMLTASQYSFSSQSDMRTAAQIANNAIRDSVAVFVLPESSFINAKKTPGWDYFGMEPIVDPVTKVTTGSAIVWYQYQYADDPAVIGAHSRHVIMKSSDGVAMDLTFALDNPDNQGLLSFALNSYMLDKDGNRSASAYQTIVSETKALNALQVISWAAGSDPGVAIAFRKDDRPLPQVQAAANVVVVLDYSGSMQDKPGSPLPGEEKPKIQYLEQATTALLDVLCSNEFINVNIIYFSDTATHLYSNTQYNTSIGGRYPKLSAIDNPNLLNAKINETMLRDLTTKDRAPNKKAAQTNTSDGLRLAYHTFRRTIEEANAAGKLNTNKNYLVVMTDGATNMVTTAIKPVDNETRDTRTYTSTGMLPTTYKFYFGDYRWDQYPDIKYPSGSNPMSFESVPPDVYAKYTQILWDDFFGQLTDYSGKPITYTTMLVGFGQKAPPGTMDSVEESLRVYKGIFGTKDEHLYITTNGKEFEESFKEIGDIILKDTWHITGPQL